jgi:hypothetical protein
VRAGITVERWSLIRRVAMIAAALGARAGMKDKEQVLDEKGWKGT